MKDPGAAGQAVSIQSISFWQQDQNYWQQAQAQSQASTADDSLINVMGQAEVNLAKGLASIANGTALKRVKSELSAAVQSALQGASGSSTSSATGGTTAASSNSAPASPTPATGTSTVPLTTTTSLSSLGILPGGTFSIDDGTNITQYTSTGTDSVADLINAINNGAAFVTASINGSGNLVITARNDKETITIGGSGNDAAALGFGTDNNSFMPKTPPASAAGSATTATPSSAASTTSTTASTGKSSSASASAAVSSFAQEMSSSAASILSASGVSGTLVDMLA